MEKTWQIPRRLFSLLISHVAVTFFTVLAGCQEGDDALELMFPKDRRIPGCLLEAIRLCTQKDPEQRPHDIEIIIKELEKFSSAGSKRGRE